jgi:hypothetical protein
MAAATCAQIGHGFRQAQIAEKKAGHVGIIMLSRMDEHRLSPRRIALYDPIKRRNS